MSSRIAWANRINPCFLHIFIQRYAKLTTEINRRQTNTFKGIPLEKILSYFFFSVVQLN